MIESTKVYSENLSKSNIFTSATESLGQSGTGDIVLEDSGLMIDRCECQGWAT